jgi:hypothetical protein
MPAELFRFAAIRPPETPTSGSLAATTLSLDSDNSSSLATDLTRARQSGASADMIKRARAYASSADFIDVKSKVDDTYFQLASVVRDNTATPAGSYFRDAFARVFASDASGLVSTPAFKKVRAQLDDSLIASAVLPDVPAKTKSLLLYLRYAVFLTEQLAAGRLPSEGILDIPIVLPSGVFPLPAAGQSLASVRAAQRDQRDTQGKQRAQQLSALAGQLRDQNTAINELVRAFQSHDVQNEAPATPSSPSPAGVPPSRKIAFVLAPDTTSKLSAGTKTVLTNIGVLDTQVDVAKAVTLLEQSNADIAGALFANSGPGQSMVRIGSQFLPSNVVNPPGPLIAARLGLGRSMGPCPPAPIDNLPATDSPTVFSGQGEARVLGIADLMVVEQELARYELGEISHIENVLRSELREHKLMTSQTTDVTNLTETEVTDQKTQDLSSTDRFELQTEAQNVINSNSGKEAGITVTASYGPSVNVTANYNTTSNTSTQDSKRASSNFARDTTSRAVSSLEKRTLQRQIVRTVNKITEHNKHNFDNTAGTNDITGIYRWLNKIYKAQIVNYGKRLILEFVVPEPAAFLRYAMTHTPVDGITLINPDPPGYCLEDGHTFQALRVQDITRDTYLFWVSKYGAQDVTPPPALLNIASASFVDNGDNAKDTTLPDGTAARVGSTKFDVSVTEGYIPFTAGINLHGQEEPEAILTVQIQDQEVANNTIGGFGRVNLSTTATQSIPVTVDSLNFFCYEVIVDVLCTLSPEKYAEWQLSTFNSIMNAYNDQKTKYDNAVQAAKIRAGFTQIQGKNPIANRETEQIELKRGCISLLTGQRFETFDAMVSNVSPYGYPEIDFVEAKVDGETILFFEESFEWTNMTYVFYPYFWSSKQEWVMLSQLDDDDPLFGKFLQAGAARVQVPVRTGFDQAMLHYLKGGFVWNTDGTLVVAEDGQPDPVQMSIIDELKSQSGDNAIDGQGTINVTNGSPAVTGAGTLFSGRDVNRRIIIKGVTYVIKSVASETSIVMSTAYQAVTDTGLEYALGGVLVGQSWEIVLPTDLIKIDAATTLIA